MSTVGTTTAGALDLSDTKETMRATLEIALLLLAGYFTLTDGVSELLHVLILTTIRHTSAKTSIYVRIYNYNIYVLPFTHFLLSILYLATRVIYLPRLRLHIIHTYTSQCMYMYRKQCRWYIIEMHIITKLYM